MVLTQPGVQKCRWAFGWLADKGAVIAEYRVQKSGGMFKRPRE